MLLITEIESLSKTVVISSAAAHHTIDGSASITWDNEGRIRFRQYLRSQGEVQSLLTERKEVSVTASSHFTIPFSTFGIIYNCCKPTSSLAPCQWRTLDGHFTTLPF